MRLRLAQEPGWVASHLSKKRLNLSGISLLSENSSQSEASGDKEGGDEPQIENRRSSFQGISTSGDLRVCAEHTDHPNPRTTERSNIVSLTWGLKSFGIPWIASSFLSLG